MEKNWSVEEKFIYLDKIFIDQKPSISEKDELLLIDRVAIETYHLNPEIITQISHNLGLTHVLKTQIDGNLCFANDSEIRQEFKQNFTNTDFVYYLYAVLQLPSYKEQYKEDLKTDSPKIPYPKDSETFWNLVKLGSKIR